MKHTLQALAAEIGRSGGKVVPVRVNVTVQEDTERMAAVAVETFGRIDGLINNAALFSALLPKRPALADRCRRVGPSDGRQRQGSISLLPRGSSRDA